MVCVHFKIHHFSAPLLLCSLKSRAFLTLTSLPGHCYKHSTPKLNVPEVDARDRKQRGRAGVCLLPLPASSRRILPSLRTAEAFLPCLGGLWQLFDKPANALAGAPLCGINPSQRCRLYQPILLLNLCICMS